MVFRVVFLAFMVAGAAGCVKTGSGSTTTNNNISFVTLMNMAPYSPSTEVYFNGIKQTSAISAGSYTSNYGQIPAGAYDIQFKVAGSDSILSEIPSSTYDSLNFYTLILYNTAGGGQTRSLKINDDFSTLSSSSANYRFFNLSPDVPAVDLYLNSATAEHGRTPADNASYGLYNIFQPLTPGVYTIQAKKAGTDSVIASATSISLLAGSPYTIFLQGTSQSTANPISLKVLLASY